MIPNRTGDAAIEQETARVGLAPNWWRRRVAGLGTLVVQDDVQQRAVDLQAAVVVNKPQFPEPVHKEANPRTGCSDHFRQHLLADLWNYVLGHAFSPKTGEQNKKPG